VRYSRRPEQRREFHLGKASAGGGRQNLDRAFLLHSRSGTKLRWSSPRLCLDLTMRSGRRKSPKRAAFKAARRRR